MQLACASYAAPLLALLATACSIDTGDLFSDQPSGSGASSQGGNGAGSQGGEGVGGPADGGGVMGGQSSQGGGTTNPVCGDGVKNGTEECDGSDFGGLTCLDFGSSTAAGLACAACFLDTSGCVAATQCGNGVQEAGEECDDNNNLDNDGCSPTCHVQGSCDTPIAVPLGVGASTIFGDNTNGFGDLSAGSAGNCNNSTGPEIVFAVHPEASGILTAYLPSSGTDFDAVLYVTDGCGGPPDNAPCHDNFGTPQDRGGEVVSFPVQQGETVLLVVDGYTADQVGAFTLELDLSSGENCEDPIPITIEGDASYLFYGSTAGHQGNANPNGFCTGSGNGPDLVYQVSVEQNGDYAFDTQNSAFNSSIYDRFDCSDSGSQIDCDAPAANNNAGITTQLDNNDLVYVWVDSVGNTGGFYSLAISH